MKRACLLLFLFLVLGCACLSAAVDSAQAVDTARSGVELAVDGLLGQLVPADSVDFQVSAGISPAGILSAEVSLGYEGRNTVLRVMEKLSDGFTARQVEAGAREQLQYDIPAFLFEGDTDTLRLENLSQGSLSSAAVSAGGDSSGGLRLEKGQAVRLNNSAVLQVRSADAEVTKFIRFYAPSLQSGLSVESAGTLKSLYVWGGWRSAGAGLAYRLPALFPFYPVADVSFVYSGSLLAQVGFAGEFSLSQMVGTSVTFVANSRIQAIVLFGAMLRFPSSWGYCASYGIWFENSQTAAFAWRAGFQNRMEVVDKVAVSKIDFSAGIVWNIL